MIDKFKAKFVEESLDNVNDLEEALFLLEKDMNNHEIIERIFRAMHSLKGGAMFGFNDLSDFTHHLETVFDLVRNDKLNIDQNLISLTFLATDHIKHLLETGNLTDPSEIEDLKTFVSKIQGYSDTSSSQVSVKEKEESIKEDESVTYLISFKPQKEILKNGTNPLYLLDDLNALGEAATIAFISEVPSLSEFDPVSNYCHWQILLNTTDPLNEIKDVFIFVEDECTIEIQKITNGNIISHPQIVKLIDEAKSTEKPLSLDHFSTITVNKKKEDSQLESKKKVQLKEHKISSIRVSSNKIDELVNLVSELVTIQAQLNLFAENDGNPLILGLAEQIQKLSRQLRDNAFEISLIPLQNELMRFQRLVRDLSKEMSKEIDFIIEGGEIELDKNIIEHLTDPLLHILRNSIDHGIESAEDRIKMGKSPKGTIIFKAYYSGANVIIKVTDDGHGIDPEKIRHKAIKKGLIDKKLDLSKKEIFDLLFLSGFSTREEVSDLSGRGVGMDVVKKKIGEIRGEVSIDSEINKGTTITLVLPLTLSIIDGLLVKVANNQYVIPISSIDKIYAIDSVKIGKTFDQVLTIEDTQYSFIKMREIFEEEQGKDGSGQLILVKYEDKKIGLLVDQIIGEYQTVVKPLGRFLKRQESISGASIMGDGSIALVIDTNRLIHVNAIKKYRTKK